jgi:hypothetical protein
MKRRLFKLLRKIKYNILLLFPLRRNNFDELEKEDLQKLFNDAINVHLKLVDKFAELKDEQFKKIHERKVKTFLKAIGVLVTNE